MVDLKFVTDVFSEEEANVIAVRVNCPQSLIEASRMVEPFDIDRQKNLLEDVKIFDAGEADLDGVYNEIKEVITGKKIPLILAERHIASLEAIRALPEGTKIVVFDAHADLKDEYSEGNYKPVDEKRNYATWLRRACEIIDPKNVCLIGVRSCDEDEFEFMKDSGLLYFTINDIKSGVESVKQRLQKFIGDSSVYVSIDMDVFDPSIVPAVENPEPNGILYSDFLQLSEVLEKIIGIDLVEIRPLAKNRVTEFLAVKVIFKLLSLIFS